MDLKIIDKFLNSLDLFETSLHVYKFSIYKFMQYLSEQRIECPKNENISAYKKTLLDKGKSPATVAIYLSALRKFFSWTETEGLYPNIAIGIKNPHVDIYHRRDAFSAEELKTITSGIDRNSLQGLRDYAIFMLMTTTGLRTCEITRADIGDIRTVQGENVLFVQGKGRSSKSEFVKLSGHVMKAIQAYLKMRGEVSENEPLFASISHRNNGGRMTTRSISRICKSAMINAGYISKRWTAHSLRHSAVTLALMAGNSLDDVSAFARHKDMAATLIYAHNFQDNTDKLSSHCEELISSVICDEAE